MKSILVFSAFLLFTLHSSAQSNLNLNTSYSARGKKFLSEFDAATLQQIHFSFADSLRKKWERLPGLRQGLKLSAFTEKQKIYFHELLRSCLSTQGYLTVTSIMFNEDIQKKFEPNLGRNEFWVEVFGDPDPGKFWSLKLEGHHLSVNFTFNGDKLISNTPFLAASNPSNSITDTARAGLIILYKQEEIARALVNTFSAEQMKAGYTSAKKPDSVYSEQDKERIYSPDEGIFYSSLRPEQKLIVQELVKEYLNMFNPGEIIPAEQFCNDKLRFFYMFNLEKGKPHYYRLSNGKQIIEYENYDNHIHSFWRTENDFGKMQIR